MNQKLPSGEWTLEKAAHLLNRAGFGGDPAQVAALYAMGLDGAVARLTRAPVPTDFPQIPAWGAPEQREKDRVKLIEDRKNAPDQKAFQKEVQKLMAERGRELVDWWLIAMRETPHPALEKLTLFWHGHFATSLQKVKNPVPMMIQNQTFREMAFGSFPKLVKAISRDPAMIRWLDLQDSKKDHPNENFARELMELFTLGEGHYTETDVLEAARAFTGYRTARFNATFSFDKQQFDAGKKTVLGVTGNLDGDAVIDAIFKQPAAATWLATKICRYYVSDTPDPAIIASVAAALTQSGFQIDVVLRQLWSSKEFYAPELIRGQVKGPIQWLLQGSRQLEIVVPPPVVAGNMLRNLGQIPFMPPSVKGWDGGKTWISTATLLQRYNYAGLMVSGGIGSMDMGKMGKDRPVGLALRHQMRVAWAEIVPPGQRKDAATLLNAACLRLLQARPSEKDQKVFMEYLSQQNGVFDDRAVSGLFRLIMSSPQYQLC